MKSNELFIPRLELDEKAITVIIAVLAILSCSPIPSSEINPALILFFSAVYSILFLKQFVTGNALLEKDNIIVTFISITFFIYIAIPFREYDRFSPSVIWTFLFSTVLFLKKHLLIKSFYIFSTIIYYVCIAALIILLLNALGVPLPHKILIRDIGGFFTSYYVSIKLSGQDYSVAGVSLYRLSGIFAEPGHFGLILSMILFMYDGIIVKTFKGKIILLTCLLTLSFGTFILLFGLLIKNIILEKKIYLAFLIITIVALSIYFIPMEVLERFFFDKAEGSIEERTSNYFINFYNSFLQEGNLSFGEGRDVLSANNIRNSDYRGFLIRYGILGILLLSSLMFSMYWKKSKPILFLGFFYFIVVLMHRSWFVDYFAFLIFLLTLTYKSYYDNKTF